MVNENWGCVLWLLYTGVKPWREDFVWIFDSFDNAESYMRDKFIPKLKERIYTFKAQPNKFIFRIDKRLRGNIVPISESFFYDCNGLLKGTNADFLKEE